MYKRQIIACVSRLVKHKGFELVAQSIHDIMGMNVQMVVLGTGEWNFEEAFRQAQAQYPGRFAARLQYSAALSTAIYGGADIFLMPSLAEPCGLSQMIAMRYGTVPVVRETGGLDVYKRQGSPPSMTATQELVVPRSIPMILDINDSSNILKKMCIRDRLHRPRRRPAPLYFFFRSLYDVE